jgi:HTH-type transcriptional regulator/antitoxin HigA
MNIRPINTKKDYKSALAKLEKIFDAKPGTPGGDELEILSILIDNYEDKYFSIDLPDPVEAIKFRMEQIGYTQKDLVGVIGAKSKVSEILNRKRKLSLPVIRKLNHTLNIPSDILIKEYSVKYDG